MKYIMHYHNYANNKALCGLDYKWINTTGMKNLVTCKDCLSKLKTSGLKEK